MLNNVVLVGRICNDLSINETKSEKKVTNITIAIPRNYKNEKGEYDTDFISIVLWDKIAENTKEYCKKGDIIGIKGRLQQENKEIKIIAEKVTFLSSKRD